MAKDSSIQGGGRPVEADVLSAEKDEEYKS